MAKGNYFPWILFIAALLFCGSTAGFRISRHPQLIRNIQPAVRNYLIISEVRKIYNSQIGVRERQANAGPQVEKYLRYVNLPKGNPWCAAFVCWVYGSAGLTNPRTGWSPDLFPAGKIIWERGTGNKVLLQVADYQLRGWVDRKDEKPLLLSVGAWMDMENINLIRHNLQPATRNPRLSRNRQDAIPRPADIFAIYFPDKRRIAHTGFIDSWDGSWLITVEGNTNDDGRRDGDGVYRKRRVVRSIYKVARYIN